MDNKLKIVKIFGNNMVLQRDMLIEVWGSGSGGKQVIVEIENQKLTTVVCNGKWRVKLSPLSLLSPENCLKMIITSVDEEIALYNILVGDVFLAGEQSNMSMPLRLMNSAEDDLPKANYKNIRIYDMAGKHYEGSTIYEGGDGETGIWQIKKANLSWQECTSYNIRTFSALGYYFAKEIHTKENIPIGIISCNWGGKFASIWISEEYLKEDSELSKRYEKYE